MLNGTPPKVIDQRRRNQLSLREYTADELTDIALAAMHGEKYVGEEDVKTDLPLLEVSEILDRNEEKTYNQDVKTMDPEERLTYLMENLDSPIFSDGTLDHLLTNKEVRTIYLARLEKLKSAIDSSLSMEQQARLASEARNRIRTEARNMMADNEAFQLLVSNRPNKTFEELIQHKMNDKNMTKEEAIRDIYETATKTNDDVNKLFGLGGE